MISRGQTNQLVVCSLLPSFIPGSRRVDKLRKLLVEKRSEGANFTCNHIVSVLLFRKHNFKLLQDVLVTILLRLAEFLNPGTFGTAVFKNQISGVDHRR